MTSDDFLKLLPDFYRNIKVFKSIFTAVAKRINKMIAQKEQLKANQFIYSEDIDEEGVDRLGKSLKTELAGLDFEDKVFKIKTLLFDNRPYNRANVRAMLESLCGENGYKIEFDGTAKSVTVKIDLGRKNQFNAVYELLDNVTPANMTLDVGLLYNLHSDLTAVTHGDLSEKTHEQIRSEVL